MRSIIVALTSAIAATRVLAVSSGAATPQDILNSMREVGKLTADTYSHAKEIGSDYNRKNRILGDTYLSCRAMIEGVEEVNDKLQSEPKQSLSEEGQEEICSAFPRFAFNQIILVYRLVREPRSIETGGFDGYFEDCFTRLKPALTTFVGGLADYAPSCRDKIMEETDQLGQAFDTALKRIKVNYSGGHIVVIPAHIPAPSN